MLFAGTVKLVIEDATRGTGITINEIKLPIPVTSPQEVSLMNSS